ncbi:hypothetical protein AHAS_Ahas16G0119900 [Arachis hypogaea]
MQGDNTVAIALGTRLPYLLHPFCDQRLLKKTALGFLYEFGACLGHRNLLPFPSDERNTSSMFSSVWNMFGCCCVCVCVCECEWNSPSFSSSISLSPSAMIQQCVPTKRQILN